jgi:hypothetical protein
MKYTKYLIEKKFVDIDSIQSNNFYLKFPIRIISIPVAFTAILAIVGMIPMTIMVDEARNIKSFYIHFKRNRHKL